MSSSSKIPSDAPPSYSDAVGPGNPASASSGPTLQVPGSSTARNGIPAHYRRSMEDEQRSLPPGFVRSFDPETNHHFYVDIRQDPPRSIWHHPLDDETYLASLSSEERERIEQESYDRGRSTSKADITAEHTDDEDTEEHHTSAGLGPSELPPRPSTKGKERTFGRKMKDKLTGSTHEQRQVERQKRADEERRMYEQHLRVRQAMIQAQTTGQPQLIGKDHNGKDVYIEPPRQTPYYGSQPYGYPGAGYPSTYPSYARPPGIYSRPAGYGYGGGYGMPLALTGGLMGGLMMGGLMF